MADDLCAVIAQVEHGALTVVSVCGAGVARGAWRVARGAWRVARGVSVRVDARTGRLRDRADRAVAVG